MTTVGRLPPTSWVMGSEEIDEGLAAGLAVGSWEADLPRFVRRKEDFLFGSVSSQLPSGVESVRCGITVHSSEVVSLRACFVLAEAAGRDIERTLENDVDPEPVFRGEVMSRPSIDGAKALAVESVRDGLRNQCSQWYSDTFGGTLGDEGLDRRPSTFLFLGSSATPQDKNPPYGTFWRSLGVDLHHGWENAERAPTLWFGPEHRWRWTETWRMGGWVVAGRRHEVAELGHDGRRDAESIATAVEDYVGIAMTATALIELGDRLSRRLAELSNREKYRLRPIAELKASLQKVTTDLHDAHVVAELLSSETFRNSLLRFSVPLHRTTPFRRNLKMELRPELDRALSDAGQRLGRQLPEAGSAVIATSSIREAISSLRVQRWTAALAIIAIGVAVVTLGKT